MADTTASLPGELQVTDEPLTSKPPGTTAEQSDNKSIASSVHSQAQTSVYQNEPWPTFQFKVQELCKQLWPDAGGFELEYFSSGGCNRVVAVKVTPPKGYYNSVWKALGKVNQFLRRAADTSFRRPAVTKQSTTPSLGYGNFVLRIPRMPEPPEYSDMDNCSAASEFASRLLTVPVPVMLHVEHGFDNPIGSPYAIQPRIPGDPLDGLWSTLNHQQRLHAAKLVGSLLKEITSHTFPAAGKVDPRDINQILAFHHACKPTNRTDLEPHGTLPADFIRTRLEDWYQTEKHGELQPYRALAEAVKDDTLGEDTNYYFFHNDLYPRNILAEVVDETTIRFTGVIDWDASEFAPAFVAFEPPVWLWMYDRYNAGDLDTPHLRIHGSVTPENKEAAELKKAFEEVVGEEWLKYAYLENAEVLRWVWEILKAGLWVSWLTELAEDAVIELTGEEFEYSLKKLKREEAEMLAREAEQLKQDASNDGVNEEAGTASSDGPQD